MQGIIYFTPWRKIALRVPYKETPYFRDVSTADMEMRIVVTMPEFKLIVAS